MNFRRPISGRTRRPPTTARPQLELLEERTQPALITWTAPVGGDWSDTANWSGGAVPGVGDDVHINLPNSPANLITHRAPSRDLVHALVSTTALSILRGTLAVDALSAVDQLDNAGTLRIGPAASLLVLHDYRQKPSGILDVPIDRINPGKAPGPPPALIVQGLASLDGTLRFEAGPDFDPATFERFFAVIYGSRSGDFQEQQSFSTRAGFDLVPDHQPNGLFVDLFESATTNGPRSGPESPVDGQLTPRADDHAGTDLPGGALFLNRIPLSSSTQFTEHTVADVAGRVVVDLARAKAGDAVATTSVKVVEDNVRDAASVVKLAPFPAPQIELPRDDDFSQLGNLATALLTGARPRAAMVRQDNREAAPVATLVYDDQTSDRPKSHEPIHSAASTLLINPVPVPTRTQPLEAWLPQSRLQDANQHTETPVVLNQEPSTPWRWEFLALLGVLWHPKQKPTTRSRPPRLLN